MQANGWSLLEHVAKSAGSGQFCSLVNSVQSAFSMPNNSGKDTSNLEPVTKRKSNGKYYYRCPVCTAAPKVTKNAMRAHIRQKHSGVVLKCDLCNFTAYNDDILSKHHRTKH